MQFLSVLGGTFCGLGWLFLLADVLKLPSLATGKARVSATKQTGKNAKSVEAMITAWWVKLAKYLPMDEYKKIRMQHTLSAAGMKETPEEFTAYAILIDFLRPSQTFFTFTFRDLDIFECLSLPLIFFLFNFI